MNPRIVLALACAVALLIALTMWLRVDTSAPRTIDVESDAPRSPTAESHPTLSAPSSVEAVVDARAPVVPDPSAAQQRLEKHLEGFLNRGVSGTVTSAKDGSPLELATISALDPDANSRGSNPLEFRTGWDGSFLIENPNVGTWVLTCSARGFASVQRSVLVKEHTNFPNTDFALTPVTDKPKLLVRLRGTDGRPFFTGLEGADLDVAKVLRPVVVANCPQRNTDLPPGTSVLPIRATAVRQPPADEWYEISMEAKENACCCLLLGTHVLDAVPFTATTDAVSLVASRDDLQRWSGAVSLTVLDDVSGQPLLAVIEARPETGDMRSTTTDAKGNARIDHLLQGEADVRILANKHAPIVHKSVIRPGETLDLGVVRMVRTIDIFGSVDAPAVNAPPGHKVVNGIDVDPTPENLQATSVFAYRIEPDQPLPQNPIAMGTADPSGAFHLIDVPPGEYLLSSVRNNPPTIKAVQEHRLLGWVYVDARYGTVNGVRVP